MLQEIACALRTRPPQLFGLELLYITFAIPLHRRAIVIISTAPFDGEASRRESNRCRSGVSDRSRQHNFGFPLRS